MTGSRRARPAATTRKPTGFSGPIRPTMAGRRTTGSAASVAAPGNGTRCGSRLLCGELQGKTDRIGHFYGSERPRLHLPLNFALLDSQWTAHALQATIDAYYNALPDGAWPVWVIGGHDKPRVAGKLGEAQ